MKKVPSPEPPEGVWAGFELANGGTIFLDEIGDITEKMQADLLRVLQEKYIERLGGEKPVPVDVRVIAATHQDLEEMVKAGRFREDLYYRLNVIPLFIPPLRSRREDIPELLEFFIYKHNQERSKPIPSRRWRGRTTRPL